MTDPKEGGLTGDAILDKFASRYSRELTRWREMALPVAIDPEYVT